MYSKEQAMIWRKWSNNFRIKLQGYLMLYDFWVKGKALMQSANSRFICVVFDCSRPVSLLHFVNTSYSSRLWLKVFTNYEWFQREERRGRDLCQWLLLVSSSALVCHWSQMDIHLRQWWRWQFKQTWTMKHVHIAQNQTNLFKNRSWK